MEGDGAWHNRLHALDIACHNCGLSASDALSVDIANTKEGYLIEVPPVCRFAEGTGNRCLLLVRARDFWLSAKSQDEWTFRIVGYLGADVLEPPFPFGS